MSLRRPPTVKQSRTTNPVSARLFVVGCSRSGTTILQREAARHLSLATVPETAFFAHGLRSAQARIGALRRLRASLRAQNAAEGSKALKSVVALGYWTRRRGIARTVSAVASPRSAAGLFVESMAEVARRSGAVGWLEKTPRHFAVIEEIRRAVPGSRFVFIIRDGRAVVASIVDRARRYPERFAKQADPLVAVRLWNHALAAAVRQVGAEDVSFVDYDVFVRAPAAVLGALEARVPVPADRPVVEEAPTVVLPAEGWKEAARSELRPAASKWTKLFPPSVRADIEARLDTARLERVWASENAIRVDRAEPEPGGR